jgi:DNA invertase Pin-like site-specific DNA recombinase
MAGFRENSRECPDRLDQLLADARRRRFDVLVCWRLDRLGRNLKHLVTLLEELQALGIAFVSLNEGIDATTPAGKLQMHVLGAIAEFERARIAERVKAGLQRARAQGKRLGRRPYDIAPDRFAAVAHLSLRKASRALGVSYSVVHRERLLRRPSRFVAEFRPETVSILTPADGRLTVT